MIPADNGPADFADCFVEADVACLFEDGDFSEIPIPVAVVVDIYFLPFGQLK